MLDALVNKDQRVQNIIMISGIRNEDLDNSSKGRSGTAWSRCSLPLLQLPTRVGVENFCPSVARFLDTGLVHCLCGFGQLKLLLCSRQSMPYFRAPMLL